MPAQVNGAYQPNATRFIQTIEHIDRSSFSDDGERSEALLAAHALVARLETPWESVSRIGLTQPATGAALKVAKDLNLFKAWDEKGEKAQTSQQLAQLVACDEVLLQRFLRHLAANNILEEVSPGLYKQTPFTLALIQPVFGGWIDYLYDATIPCFYRLPEFLTKNGYANPEDPDNGVFQYAKGISKMNLFDYYDEHPRQSKTFDDMMGGVMSRQASWLDIYPHEDLLEAVVKDESSALVVDVGGNVGRDLDRFRAAHPETASRLVLEDRAEVINDSVLPDSVQKIAHDFFKPQPIKGARAYYMHGVIHDWSDEPARKILEQLKAAMTPNYSKILIHDHVLPGQKPNPQATSYDLTMMVKVAAMERSEGQWQALLASAGLKIAKIWKSPLATQSVIEAEVA